MYTTILFALYILPLLISMICLVFIAMIFVSKQDRIHETYISARRFSILVALIDILYFIFFFRETVQGKYELTLPFRIVDYILCTSIYLFWLLLVSKMLPKSRYRKMVTAGSVLTGIRLICSLVITIFFMDSYYNIENDLAYKLWVFQECLFVFLTALLIICCCIFAFIDDVSSLRKKYVTAGSLLLLTLGFRQLTIDIGLFAGKYGMSAWDHETVDLTGAIMCLLQLATCIFVFKEDFSPLFFSEQATVNRLKSSVHAPGSAAELTGDICNSPEAPSESEISYNIDPTTIKLDAIAADHKLTVREREVMELIYRGYTNPDIGEALFISINTVKKHTHNLFEKLDVTNRMEVVYLINAWESRKE